MALEKQDLPPESGNVDTYVTAGNKCKGCESWTKRKAAREEELTALSCGLEEELNQLLKKLKLPTH